MFPSHIVQKQDGFPSLDLTIALCDGESCGRHHGAGQRARAQPPPVRVESAKLADGVY